MPSRKFVTTILPILAAFLLPLVGVGMQSAHAQRPHSPCIVVIGGPQVTCLGPSELFRVRGLFPRAIDPTPAVQAVSGLRFATANVIYDRQHQAIEVQFYYGAARAYHTVPPIVARPQFLMVAESVGHLDPRVRFWYSNTPWGHYRGYVAHLNLSFVVFGNVKQRVVQQIVRRVTT
jgi:hypothetical protein